MMHQLFKNQIFEKEDDLVILKLENDIENTDSNKISEVENFWSNVNGFQTEGTMFKEGESPKLSFEILSDNGGASFFFSIPKKYKNIMIKKLNAVYPYIDVTEVNKDPVSFLNDIKEDEYVSACELVFTENPMLSIKTKGAEKTFLNNLLNTINHFEEDEITMIQIMMKPLPENWSHRKIINIRRGFRGKHPALVISLFIMEIIIKSLTLVVDILFTKGELNKSFKVTSKEEKNENIDKDSKQNKPCFNVSIRIATKSKDKIVADQIVKSVATVFKDFDDKNKLRPISINIRPMIERSINKKSEVFSVTELSQMAHLPNKNVSADNVSRVGVKTPYDKEIPNKGIIFGISPQQNNRSLAFPMTIISNKNYKETYEQHEKIIDNICKPRLVLGQMGTGKSEWIINYALNLIKYGVSVILVDPKNDTQKRLIESIPDDCLDKIDYLDLGDLIYPPALNLLRRRNPGDPTEISLIVQSLINFFKKEFSRSWGFAMQQLIMMTGNAILLDEVASLYEFQLMLTNKDYREKIIKKIENILNEPKSTGKTMMKELLQFWKQFHMMSEKEQMERIKSTMNKIGVFMSNRIIRAIVSQRESYDFRKAGDNGKITIVNIPDGELGDENTRLLASFINKAVWLDFRSRTNIPISSRYPTVWLIEEAHMIMDEEFVPVLTQSRGYRLGVTILTQGLTNFDNKGMKELRDLILTNCKNKIVFRVGPQDAGMLVEEFAPLTRYDLMNCPDYHFYSKILLDGGKVSNTFYGRSLDVAPVLRSYDIFKENHRFGKLTIDEIENQLDERHSELNDSMMIFNMNDEETDIIMDENIHLPKKKMVELISLD